MEKDRKLLTGEELLHKNIQEERMGENPLTMVQIQLRDDMISWRDFRAMMRAVELSSQSKEDEVNGDELKSQEEC